MQTKLLHAVYLAIIQSLRVLLVAAIHSAPRLKTSAEDLTVIVMAFSP